MSDDFQDRELICADCNKPFVFEAGEQKFFAERNFSDPKRCKGCRAERKARKDSQGNGSQRHGRQEEDYSRTWADDRQTWEDDRRDRGRGRRRR